MRVTNTMMRNNSLLHMQKNKNAENTYLNQYSSLKKIQRPSDDPTIAVRALKYRTTLAEIKQYLKNIDDATAWMDETDAVLHAMDDKLDALVEYCNQASTGTVKPEDRHDIVLQLQEFSSYIYEQEANQDYAGRYLLTGYRTDVPLLFDDDQDTVTYTITETPDINDINRFEYVYGGAVYGDTKDASDYADEAPEFLATHRLLLSYDNLDAEDKGQEVVVKYTDETGAEQTLTVDIVSVRDDVKNNDHLHPANPDDVYFVPETGELVFGDAIYDSLRKGSNLSVTYKKTNFEKNDIRPEHYFDCDAKDNVTNATVSYRNPGAQAINYQINFSQNLTVNTVACNALGTGVRRMVDDMINICNEIDVIEANLTSVQKRISDCDESETEKLADLHELESQLETQLALQTTVVQKALGTGITISQKQKDQINVAYADHGARVNRMNLTKSKLESQQTDTEEAKTENEDANLGEVYINFTEADLLYQATLSATNKILGKSLLDFI